MNYARNSKSGKDFAPVTFYPSQVCVSTTHGTHDDWLELVSVWSGC